MSSETTPSPGELLLDGLAYFAGRQTTISREEAGARLAQGIAPIVASHARGTRGLSRDDFAQELMVELIRTASTLRNWSPGGAFIFAREWARSVSSDQQRSRATQDKHLQLTSPGRSDLPGAGVIEAGPANLASEHLDSASELAALKKVALRLIFAAKPVHRTRIVAYFRRRLGLAGFDLGPDPEGRSAQNVHQDRSIGSRYARLTLERIAPTLDALELSMAERLLSDAPPGDSLPGEEEPS